MSMLRHCEGVSKFISLRYRLGRESTGDAMSTQHPQQLGMVFPRAHRESVKMIAFLGSRCFKRCSHGGCLRGGMCVTYAAGGAPSSAPAFTRVGEPRGISVLADEFSGRTLDSKARCTLMAGRARRSRE